MKRFIIATLLALLLSSNANAQAATVDLNKATINWTFTLVLVQDTRKNWRTLWSTNGV
jgi:hypothetical protein